MPIAANKNGFFNRTSLFLIATDLFSFCLSYSLAIFIRSSANSLVNRPLEPVERYWLLIVLNILIMFLIFNLMGLYRGYGTVAIIELRNLTLSIIIADIIMAFSAYLIGEGNRLSRIVFILSLFFCLIIVPLFRFIIYNRFSKNKSWGHKVAVIASRDEFPNITSRLQKIRRLGFHPEIILCTDNSFKDEKVFGGIPVYKYSSQMCQEIKSSGINFAFYTSKNLSDKDPILIEISMVFPTVYYVLPESNLSSLWVDVTDLSGRPTLKVRYYLLDSAPKLAKRIIELIIAVLILIITLPFLLIAALLIIMEDRGPVFYKQDRLGLYGKPFKLFKFRTMVVDADSVLEMFLSKNLGARLEHEEFHKLEKDPRITRIGSFLRKYSIDEFPQILNVIRGNMNLIGPRAYMVHELNLNDELTITILKIRPGVTGWWQVMGRNEATFADRQKLDLYYIANWSLWMDYYILIKTFWIILSGQGK